MFSVFFDYLTPLNEAKIVNLTEQSTPSEIFNQLRIAYNQGVKGIEDCTRLFVLNPEEDEELFECIHDNNELMTIVRWANRNILLKLGKISYKMLGVHLRIICSMLTKLKENGRLRADKYYILHSNLTKNVLDLHYEISTEELPF